MSDARWVAAVVLLAVLWCAALVAVGPGSRSTVGTVAPVCPPGAPTGACTLRLPTDG